MFTRPFVNHVLKLGRLASFAPLPKIYIYTHTTNHYNKGICFNMSEVCTSIHLHLMDLRKMWCQLQLLPMHGKPKPVDSQPFLLNKGNDGSAPGPKALRAPKFPSGERSNDSRSHPWVTSTLLSLTLSSNLHNDEASKGKNKSEERPSFEFGLN